MAPVPIPADDRATVTVDQPDQLSVSYGVRCGRSAHAERDRLSRLESLC